ncbi:Spermidine/putrescine ABC transporter, permease and substrate-binding component [Mycoplasma yeatsii 13926]|uniref:Spermidine/putrescine ABC transporter, permease and substrate-binding component n=1 Tax=Mycoplasma yeatsii 13926 TaxID=1188240 RepID=S6G3R2_9MOLU|nr:spermidine/putrescine ABC transporter permease/substrate-binding protein [Mycoplasma yeatsii]EOA07112.1 Spermidine/putrescine ABC transporter, permease and substrate-binding component [Mycoplasma yeatsii 13926]
MKRFLKNSYFAIIIAFIYAPIVAMVVLSFNGGETTLGWEGFSFRWYSRMFSDSPFLKSIFTSIFVAVVSTIVSVIIGTLAAIGLSKTKRATRNKWYSIANVPLINADVVTAVSLMIVFLLSGLKFGILTLIMAHISFNVPYVLITVMPRLRKIDPSLIDASYDLGAKNHQVMFKVIIPILKPAIITASAIAFAMSFDDFIISYFTGGDQTNISTFIYTAKKIKPFVFAFGTGLVAIIAICIITWNAIVIYKQYKTETKQKIQNNTYKLKELSKLNKELENLKDILNNKTIIKTSFRLSLWFKYFILKFRLFIFKANNYDKKISKLQWKQYKLKSKIGKEKRYEVRLKKANKKLNQLNKQLSKTTDVKKAAKLTLQIQNLEEKIEFLEDKIEVIKEREKTASLKIKKIKAKIRTLKKELKQEKDPSKKLVEWYKNKINYLEEWIIELEEGKDHYKLRMVVEKLRDFQDVRKNKINELTDKIDEVLTRIYKKVLITNQIDLKIQMCDDQEQIQHLEEEKQKLISNFETKYQNKIDKKQIQLNKLTEHVINLQKKLLIKNQSKYHAQSFIARTWKTFSVVILTAGAFSGLTTAYVLNNTYDLIVANWGEYIDEELIEKFEKENNKKISYQTYDSNENLYNKIQTVGYDVMVPSDYMIQRLANEGRIQKLDYSKLNVWGTFKDRSGTEITFNKPEDGTEENKDENLTLMSTEENTDQENNSNSESSEEKKEPKQIQTPLLETMVKSEVRLIERELEENKDDKEQDSEAEYLNTDSIIDYAVPYLWGDMSIIVNPTQENKQFLKKQGVEFIDGTNETEIKNSTLSWEILWEAAKAGKNVVLNNDPKNIFMIGAQRVGQIVNIESKEVVDEAAKYVEDLVRNPNVSLNGDDLIDKATIGNFDFAFMYNGDAATANTLRDEEGDPIGGTKGYIFGRPNKKHEVEVDGKTEIRYETTNIYSDSMVISTECRDLELAYKFINFIYENALAVSEYVGQASPLVSVDEEITNSEGEDKGFYWESKNLYLPITSQEDKFKLNGNEKLAYTYNGKVDNYLVNKFTKIVAGKR